MTLAAHAEAIRKLTRGDPARRPARPGKQPAFEQLAPDPELGLLSSSGPQPAPVVQAPSLDAYERVLEEVAA